MPTNQPSNTSNMHPPLRIAVIGLGAISRNHLTSLHALSDRFTLTAVCDSNAAAVARTVTDYPNARGFATVADLIDSGCCDAAVIGTPHFLHAEQAAALAAAGISVLVEKPLAVSTAQLRELDAVAERTGALVIAGQTRRFEADMIAARELMQRPDSPIGALRSFDVQSLQDLEAYTVSMGPRHWLMDAKLAGGGVTISNAVHQIDAIRFLTGADFTTVCAFARYDEPFIHGAESQLSAVLALSNGATGTLQASYTARKIPFSEAMTLVGERGSITQHANALGDYRGPVSFASTNGVPAATFADQLAGWQPVPAVAGIDPAESNFVGQLRCFADSVSGVAEPQNTVRHNFNTIACIEALMRSARTRETVAVESW